jgi:hypothetical protein
MHSPCAQVSSFFFPPLFSDDFPLLHTGPPLHFIPHTPCSTEDPASAPPSKVSRPGFFFSLVLTLISNSRRYFARSPGPGPSRPRTTTSPLGHQDSDATGEDCHCFHAVPGLSPPGSPLHTGTTLSVTRQRLVLLDLSCSFYKVSFVCFQGFLSMTSATFFDGFGLSCWSTPDVRKDVCQK